MIEKYTWLDLTDPMVYNLDICKKINGLIDHIEALEDHIKWLHKRLDWHVTNDERHTTNEVA